LNAGAPSALGAGELHPAHAAHPDALAAIGRRAWQNRAIMWVMIGMLVLLLVLLLFTLAHRGGAASKAPEMSPDEPVSKRSLLLRL